MVSGGAALIGITALACIFWLVEPIVISVQIAGDAAATATSASELVTDNQFC